jgi:hypothetical protein
MDRAVMEPDEDPDEALAVILGETRGNKAYAVICLAGAITRGDFPAGWDRPGQVKPRPVR